MRIAAAIVLVAALVGCASTPRDQVRVTRDAADVEHCKHIGAVQTVAPYALPGDDIDQIRNRTMAAGADTVLLNTSQRASLSGVAYRCRTS